MENKLNPGHNLLRVVEEENKINVTNDFSKETNKPLNQ
jgi:hypothetical protein